MTNELAIQEMLTVASHLKQTSQGEAVMMGVVALEKQIQKKPNQDYDKVKNLTYYKCPCCGEDVITFTPENRMTIKEHHCRCGQAILWSKDND